MNQAIKCLKGLVLLSTLACLVLLYQNCSEVGFQHSPNGVPHEDSIFDIPNQMSGNGDGYTGMQLKVSPFLKPGESTTATIIGGLPPYTLEASSPDVVVSATVLENEFKVSLDANTLLQTFELKARDQTGQEVTKDFWVYVLEIPELHSDDVNSAGGKIGDALGINSHMAVVRGRSNRLNGYSEGDVFSFSHANNIIEKFEADLFVKDDERHEHKSLDLSENYLLTGYARRKVGSVDAAGSVTLYRSDPNGLQLIDYIPSPNPKYANNFGISVSLFQEEFAVGSHRTVYDLGQVHLFSIINDKAELQQTITSPNKKYVQFGKTIKLSKDFLFITSLLDLDDEPGANPGINPKIVHIYKKEGLLWAPHQLINLIEISSGIRQPCGYKIEAENNRFVISCSIYRETEAKGEYTGTSEVYVFHYKNGQWSLTQQLKANIPDIMLRNLSAETSFAANKDILAIVDIENGNGVNIYKYNTNTSLYEEWKRVDLTGFSVDDHSQLDLYENKLLVSTNAVYKAYSLIIDLFQ